MKLIFAGTPDFAASALQALVAAGHEIVLVLTQPDRPAGRGMMLKPGPVRAVALAHDLPVAQPQSLKNPEAVAMIRDAGAEVMIVAAYGLLLPQAILDLFPRGCINLHGSILPRWRGAAPVQRAIQAGDQETGITIMQMDAGLDTGPMLARYPLPIEQDDTSASLFAKLTAMAANAIVETLAVLDSLTPVPQPAEGVSYAHKISKQEARIDWSASAQSIARTIRAFNPAPGAYTTHAGGTLLKCWQAQACPGLAAPGQVVRCDAGGVMVGTGAGLVCISELQVAGGKRLTARAFLLGHPEVQGTWLE